MRFIDTDVPFHVATAHPQFGETAREILERIEDGERAVTSTIVLCEEAWVLEAIGRQGDIKRVLEITLSFKNIEVLN